MLAQVRPLSTNLRLHAITDGDVDDDEGLSICVVNRLLPKPCDALYAVES